MPTPFIATFSLRGRIYEKVRMMVHRLCEWNPFVVLTARKATIILASSPETHERISHLVAGKCAIASQVGIADHEFGELSVIPFKTSVPFRAFSAGILTHYKGYHLSLSAFAEFNKENPDSEYWIFGDGPERGRLQAICRDLGIEKAVTFCGQVKRGQYLAQISNCDVFLHPCLHESGGWAIAEALSAGRPVICLDLGGPSMQIEPLNGYKIKPHSPEYVISEMSRMMKYLAAHLEFRHSLSQNAISRIEQSYLWSKKGFMIATLYNDLLAH
ncbi:MAG: glycosyltransferase [Chloroflexi bacterium]|nr:glycosyltransferase [Chloroflexota bacterium]